MFAQITGSPDRNTGIVGENVYAEVGVRDAVYENLEHVRITTGRIQLRCDRRPLHASKVRPGFNFISFGVYIPRMNCRGFDTERDKGSETLIPIEGFF